jgi:hypothetical protein
MKKKILVEDIERMVREEVSKRLSEQETVDSNTMDIVRAARFSLYSALRDDGMATEQSMLDRLKRAGVDLDKLHSAFEKLAYDKWTPDIIAAVRASMKK